MSDYGQAGGLSYAIPQKFIQHQTPGSPQAGIEPQGVYGKADDPSHPLAERERLTDDYYNNYGILDSYAKDMAKKGVNVFEPDYSQPGGGEAFKTFQRMQANVMHGANALKVEMEAEKEMRKQEAEGHARIRPGVKREGLYYSNPENFYSRAIAPEVLQANTQINQETNTPQDSKKVNAAQRAPMLHHLQEVRKRLVDEGKPTDEIDNDIAALSTNVDRADPSVMAAYARASRAGSGGAKYDTSIFKKLYNIGRGSWAPGTHKIISNPTHGAVWSYEGLKGDKFGTYRDTKTNPEKPVDREKIIKDVYISPKTHEVYVSFQDSNIPDETVQDAYHFAREVISNNAKHGDFARTMRAVFEEGMGDEDSGGVVDELVLDPKTGNYQNEMLKQMGNTQQRVGQKQQADKDVLKKLETGFVWNQEKEFQTPKGEVLIKKYKGQNDDSFRITNWESLWPDGEPEQYKNLTADQVVAKIHELGGYEDAMQEPAPTEVPAPQAKSFTYKGKSVTIEQLKQNGWTDKDIAAGVTKGLLTQ